MVNDNRKGIAEHWTRNMIEEARVDRRAPWQTSRLAVLLLHQVLHDTKISRTKDVVCHSALSISRRSSSHQRPSRSAIAVVGKPCNEAFASEPTMTVLAAMILYSRQCRQASSKA